MRRRHFLTLSAATLGGVLIYSLDRKASLLAAQHKAVRIPLRFFTETEALIVAAAASRIFPSDDSGPGAREAGVARTTVYRRYRENYAEQMEWHERRFAAA